MATSASSCPGLSSTRQVKHSLRIIRSFRLPSPGGPPSVESMLNASLTGLLTGLSLIVAIGAQNAFVLRQGLRRARVGPIVSVCLISDIALIVAGVAGIGAVVQHADWALQAVRWFGVAFLTWYGLSSAWRARRPSALAAPADETAAAGTSAAVRAPGA